MNNLHVLRARISYDIIPKKDHGRKVVKLVRLFEIFTDSSSDITAKMIAGWRVTVIPLKVHLGNRTYNDDKDERELTYKEVFEKLRTDIPASTSALNIEDYKRELGPTLQKGKDILVVSFSSELSSTYANGYAAVNDLQEQYPGQKIRIVDSKCVSLGLGLLLSKAVALADEGKPIGEVEAFIRQTIPKVNHWFTVENLKRLRQGGRISATSAALGGLLNIKPVLCVDDAGKLQAVAKARGRKSSIEALASRVAERIVRPEEQTVFIAHGDCMGDVQVLVRKIKEKVPVKGFEINYVGPVIGAHTGAGLLAVFFLGEKR